MAQPEEDFVASERLTWGPDDLEFVDEEDSPPTRSADHDSLRLRGILTERAAGKDVTPGHDGARQIGRAHV